MIKQSPSDPSLPLSFDSQAQQPMKFSQLKNSLINCDIDFIINLLIQELEKADKLQADLKEMDKLFKLVQDQNKHLKDTLSQKRVAFKQLCETQQRNLQSIQHLEKQLYHLRHKYHLSKQQTQYQQSTIEKKYRELSKCMNEYVTNTADIQEEFKRNFFILKNENIRLHAQNENLSLRLKEQMITITARSREVENMRILHKTAAQLKSDNQRLLKEIYHYQQVQKDLYEGVASMETERLCLEKQLQKVRQICQNSTTTNKEISERYESLLVKYSQQEKERMIIADNCRGSNHKIKQLETCIKKEHQEYSNMLMEIDRLKKLNTDLQMNNIELISQTAGLQKKLIESETYGHKIDDANKILEERVRIAQSSNKGLKDTLQKTDRQRQREKGKTDLICRQVQNFINQSNGLQYPRAVLKSTKDLSNIRSLKTMTTSSSQSRVDKMNDQNAKPH